MPVLLGHAHSGPGRRSCMILGVAGRLCRPDAIMGAWQPGAGWWRVRLPGKAGVRLLGLILHGGRVWSAAARPLPSARCVEPLACAAACWLPLGASTTLCHCSCAHVLLAAGGECSPPPSPRQIPTSGSLTDPTCIVLDAKNNAVSGIRVHGSRGVWIMLEDTTHFDN